MAKKLIVADLDHIMKILPDDFDELEKINFLAAMCCNSRHCKDHEFQKIPGTPGVCGKCHWVDPRIVCDNCGAPIVRHLQAILAELKSPPSVRIVIPKSLAAIMMYLELRQRLTDSLGELERMKQSLRDKEK